MTTTTDQPRTETRNLPSTDTRSTADADRWLHRPPVPVGEQPGLGVDGDPYLALTFGRIALAGFISLLVIGLAAGSGYLWSKTKDERYAARSEIQYLIDNDTNIGDSFRRMETERILIENPSFLAPIAATNDLTVKMLTKDLAVTSLRGSEVIRIEYVDIDPSVALDVVRQITDIYVNRSQVSERSVKQLDYLDEQIIEAQADLSVAQDATRQASADYLAILRALDAEERDDIPETAAIELARNGVERATVRLNDLNNERDLLSRSQLVPQGAQPLTAPWVFEEPVEPTPVRGAALGALLGVLLASLIGYVILKTPPR